MTALTDETAAVQAVRDTLRHGNGPQVRDAVTGYLATRPLVTVSAADLFDALYATADDAEKGAALYHDHAAREAALANAVALRILAHRLAQRIIG